MITITIISLIVFLIINFRNKKYFEFAINNSKAIKELAILNNKYIFKTVSKFDLTHSYDNETYYNKVMLKDYLTYELIFLKRKVEDAIENANYNYSLYPSYVSEVKNINSFGEFGTFKRPRNLDKLITYEKKIFSELVKKPIISFQMKVTLYLTKINGRYVDHKSKEFHVSEIKQVIKDLSKKDGNRYLDREIWDSVSIVERAKVSNKLRFAIYNRDGYRCRICHRKTNDLEIDHIIPIAKGGKTEYNNLQTLCKKCNKEKSDKIMVDYSHINNQKIKIRTCPRCGAPLKYIRNVFGEVYVCTKYPNCNYKTNE